MMKLIDAMIERMDAHQKVLLRTQRRVDKLEGVVQRLIDAGYQSEFDDPDDMKAWNADQTLRYGTTFDADD